MVKEIEIFQIDAFTNVAFCGNPAGVTFSNNLSETEKQLIAKEMNLSETAFISSSDNADFKLQWFTPTNEVKLCGHATVASLHFLFEKGIISDNQTITFETLSGIIKCSVNDGKYLMQIPIPELNEFNGCKEEVLDALGIERVDVCDLPFIILNNGYLFIALNSLKALWNINPDFKYLNVLSNSHKEFFDIAVFTIETVENNSSAHLRFFAPYHGIDEDPVTGSACGPLLLVLNKLGLINNSMDDSLIQIEQGDVLDRKGRVLVKYNSANNELYIAGSAVTLIKGEMFF
ncbi:MAG: PhzF family phenazine biosynthesis protein [Ignavibacteriales bacterium]|nr:PhzF family phenazine biosynthesis protein [Ignavibacteriales bacterium]